MFTIVPVTKLSVEQLVELVALPDNFDVRQRLEKHCNGPVPLEEWIPKRFSGATVLDYRWSVRSASSSSARNVILHGAKPNLADLAMSEIAIAIPWLAVNRVSPDSTDDTCDSGILDRPPKPLPPLARIGPRCPLCAIAEAKLVGMSETYNAVIEDLQTRLGVMMSLVEEARRENSNLCATIRSLQPKSSAIGDDYPDDPPEYFE